MRVTRARQQNCVWFLSLIYFIFSRASLGPHFLAHLLAAAYPQSTYLPTLSLIL